MSGMSKLCKAVIALLAVASIGVAAPQAASARGGFGGHGGFGGGGFHGGGFHGGGWGGYHGFHRGYGFAPGLALGLGLYAPYYYGGYPYYDYPYAGHDEDYYGGDCLIVHRRVHTRYGWRYRTVHVCE